MWRGSPEKSDHKTILVLGYPGVVDHPLYLRQPYMRKILKLARKLPLKKGAKYLAGILHDDDCPALSGGFCRCNPEITLYVVERKKRGCKK